MSSFRENHFASFSNYHKVCVIFISRLRETEFIKNSYLKVFFYSRVISSASNLVEQHNEFAFVYPRRFLLSFFFLQRCVKRFVPLQIRKHLQQTRKRLIPSASLV